MDVLKKASPDLYPTKCFYTFVNIEFVFRMDLETAEKVWFSSI